MFEYQTSNSLIRLNSRQSSINNSQNRLFYKALFLCIIFSYTSTSVEAQSSYQCEFYDNGIAVSNGASMLVPYSGEGAGYEWQAEKYPNTFFAEEWSYFNEPTYKFRSNDEGWAVLNPKTDKEAQWANGQVKWTCVEIPIANPNDFDDKSNSTVDCNGTGAFGAFDMLKFNLKRLSATSVYAIDDWVVVDFGRCKKLK